MKILLTSTSFQDTPGKHQDLLATTKYQVDTLRGPLKKEILLPIIANYDGVICGDDEYTKEVIEAGRSGKLRIISKYGIGLDKIDLEAAEKQGVKVTNCPGVNHTTVAEHVFALLLSYVKHIPEEIKYTQQGNWTRLTGNEIFGKTMAIFGLGKIGKEIAIRANAFGMKVKAFDLYKDNEFAKLYNIEYSDDVDYLLANSNIISLNMNLSATSKHIISRARLEKADNPALIIINTARGELIEREGLIWALKNDKIKAYLTDVLDEEPMRANDPLKDFKNVFITPHIGSRTFESVERQGLMAVQNLLDSWK